MTQFLGHFHPLLVHLPIGILLFAILLQWLSRQEKYSALQPAIRLALFCGAVSAIASVITGLLLSQNGEYATGSLNMHKWLGISVAITSCLFYFWKRKASSNKNQNPLAILLFILLVVTGHFGGTLTHGEGYLTQHLPRPFQNWLGIQTQHVADIKEARVYQNVIAPILQNKCYACHGPEKQKGGLRMDIATEFQKGGKDGAVFIAGNPDESEMLRRVSLKPSDEDHMPPEGKPQLDEKEISLLHWWIATGASFDKKVNDLPQTGEIKSALASLLLQNSPEKFRPEFPTAKVAPPDASAMQKLREAGVLVLPLAKGSHYLEASFINADSANIKLLEPLAPQLVGLNLSGAAIADSGCVTLAKLTQLRKLHLQNTGISEAGLRQLHTLAQLQSLNLVGTKITTRSFAALSGLKNLRQLYLYQTPIDSAGLAQLRALFPNTHIEMGGYAVATLASDTTEVKPPKAP
jgi:uncharacterized membrane protein